MLQFMNKKLAFYNIFSFLMVRLRVINERRINNCQDEEKTSENGAMGDGKDDTRFTMQMAAKNAVLFTVILIVK